MEDKIKSLLAQHIGVEEEDIKGEDLLLEDLHMGASEIADFFSSLDDAGMNVSKINMAEIKTVDDLLESLNSHEEI